MFFLGFLSGLTDLISMDALSRALEESVSENLLERNLRALEGGYIQGLEMRKRDGQALRVSWGK
jgi:Pyruvate/2-oxoacid:ferredoxin oxidoreductase gamma subunit